MATYKVLGIDPGKKEDSFAYALFIFNDETYEMTPVTSGYLGTTISNMNNTELFFDFYAELQSLLEYLEMESNDVVVAEQYFTRGRFKKGNSESYINFMLGIIYVLTIQFKLRYFLYLPSVWKTKFHSTYNEYADTYMKNINGTEKHEADASGLAYYYKLRFEVDAIKASKKRRPRKTKAEK